MLLPAVHFSALLLACIFAKSFSAFKNDATEILYSHVVKPAPASPGSNSTLNQARNGGRHYAGTAPERGSEYPSVRPPVRRPLSCGVLPGGEPPGVKEGGGGTLPAVPRGLLPAPLLPPAVPGEGTGSAPRPGSAGCGGCSQRQDGQTSHFSSRSLVLLPAGAPTCFTPPAGVNK